jgi:hypothetical protein
VEHDPEPFAVVLQLDEVVAAAKTAELRLASPGGRVLRDVPVVVDGDAVALGRPSARPQRFCPAAYDLLEALR